MLNNFVWNLIIAIFNLKHGFSETTLQKLAMKLRVSIFFILVYSAWRLANGEVDEKATKQFNMFLHKTQTKPSNFKTLHDKYL